MKMITILTLFHDFLYSLPTRWLTNSFKAQAVKPLGFLYDTWLDQNPSDTFLSWGLQ